MAEDITQLLDDPDITSTKIRIVGHDIGGMIVVAWAMAYRHPDRVMTVNWGEFPLPGTSVQQEDRTSRVVEQFH